MARRWTAFTLWSLGFPLGVGHSSRLRPKCGCNGLQARGCTASPTHGSYPTSGRLGRGVSARVATACRGLDRGLRQPFVSASARGPRVSERHTPAARLAVPRWQRHSECGPPQGRRGGPHPIGWAHNLLFGPAQLPGAARAARGQLAALRRACAPKLLRAQLAPGTAPLNWSSDCIILSRFGLPALFKLRIRHPQGLLCYGAASIAVWLLAAAKPRPRPACSGRRQMASLHSGRLPTHHLPGPGVPACMGSLVAGNAHALDGSST